MVDASRSIDPFDVPLVLRPAPPETCDVAQQGEASGRLALDMVSFRIIGLTGEEDAADLGARLGRLHGVQGARVELAAEHATVWVSDPSITPAWLREVVRDAGYEAVEQAPDAPDEESRRVRVELRRLAAVAATGVPAWLLDLATHLRLDTWMPTDVYRWDLQIFLTSITVFWGGRHLWWRMVTRASLGHTELLAGLLEEGPGALAIVLGFLVGLVGFLGGHGVGILGTTAALAVLLQAGRALDEMVRARLLPHGSATPLGMPETTVVLRDDREFVVRTRHLASGDLVVVGDRDVCPVGGLIEEGTAVLDDSLITGRESHAERGPGDQVFAGAVVRRGRIVVRARRLGARTLLARVSRMAGDVTRSRGPAHDVAARLAIFVNAAALLSAVAAAVVGGLNSGPHGAWIGALAVLASVGARAVILAVPVAVSAASGLAARHGILLRDADALDAAADARVVALGRVGVLTAGRATIPDFRMLVDDVTEGRALAVAAAVERGLRHPVAQAFVAYARSRGVEMGRLPSVTGVRRVPGHGALAELDGEQLAIGNEAHLAQLGTEVPDIELPLGSGGIPLAPNYIAIGGRVVAVAFVDDPMLPEAVDGVYVLRKRRLRPVLLTGEDRPVVQALARAVGIEEAHGGITPEEQRAVIAALRAKGEPVAAVVGAQSDVGLLEPANVGFLLLSESRLPNADAGVILLRGTLEGVTATVSIARKLRHVLHTSQALIGAYHVAAFALAFMGLLQPVGAAFGSIMLSLVVTQNGLRAATARVEAPKPPRRKA